MGATYPTAAEIAQVSGTRFFQGLIDLSRTATPIFNAFNTRTVTGTRFKTLALGTLPTEPTFVNLNEGYTASKTLFTLGEVGLAKINRMVKVQASSEDLWNSENVAADQDYFTIQALYSFKMALVHLEKVMLYGTAYDAKGFPGMKQLTPALTTNTLTYATPTAPEDDFYVRSFINAGGTTASTASSIYAVKFGPLDAQLILGGPSGIQGFLNLSPKERVLQSVTDPVDGIVKDDWFNVSTGEGYVGLSVAGSNETTRGYAQQSIRRVGNVTRDSGKGCTEALLDYLIESFPSDKRPDAIFLSARSLRQFRDSKPVASIVVNEGGNVTSSTVTQPLADNHRGIPLIVSDNILNTDAIEVPA